MQFYHQISHQDLGRTYKTIQEEIIKLLLVKETKTTDNKIEQKKAQFNLDRQTANISALSSENVSKCEFVSG